MSNRAWVTLATNDSYGLGALVLAHSLRRAGSTYPAVVLITPSVTDAMRDRLSAVFAEVVMVDVLDSGDAAHLALLQRPELGITFTKIHCWNLTQYEKCVFLDADTLVVQNCDELFEREELSAAPDVGWPDCFNSGVFVYRPSAQTFAALIEFAQQRGSFDGGDQGLLNSYFSDWAHGDINKHLPFLYNVTSAAFYSYLPALKHYGQNLRIIHFIGAAKPWLQQFDWRSRQVEAPEHLRQFLQLWWDLFVAQVHPQLDAAMTGVAGNLARVTPDSLGAQSAAIDELSRRQGWEAGNMDYMGADSFDNIWAKISQTLSQPPSPPKQPTPPPTEAAPVEAEQPAAAVESVTSETPAPAAEEPAKEVESSPETPSETALPEPVLSEEASLPVETADIPVESSVPVEIPVPVVEAVLAETAAPVAADAPIETEEIPAPVLEASALDSAKAVETKEEPLKEETVAAPAATEAPPSAKVAESPKAEATATDSPPLANTPSTEAIPSEPAAKSEERRRPAGKLQLSPPSAADPLPTPDSELEDAASLAQSIIASELRTPTVTSPSPPVLASPPQPHQDKRLSAEGPQLPTPPIGAVSLTQIGVKPTKGKATIAAQIESSVADKPEQTPAEAKKKVVKKVAKGPSSEAPVPPPRKKEKKPKEK